MTNFLKYDVVVVKFPFASSLKYKARPVVIISSEIFNTNRRETLMVLAISSSHNNKLDYELELDCWQEAGLLKPSVFKSSIATIDKDVVISKIGTLHESDIRKIQTMIGVVC